MFCLFEKLLILLLEIYRIICSLIVAIIWCLSHWPLTLYFWIALKIRCFSSIDFSFRLWFSVFWFWKFQTYCQKMFSKILFSEKWAINREVRTNTHLKNHWIETKDKGSTAGNWNRQTIATAISDGSQRNVTNDAFDVIICLLLTSRSHRFSLLFNGCLLSH